jgi:hypothetical protein
MSKTVMNSFVKSFVAKLSGDNATVVGEKAWRQAKNALTAEIATSEGDLISYEDEVERCVEELNSARVNGGNEISDRKSYVTNLIVRKNKLTDAQENLDAHKERIAFLKEELSSLGKED